MQYPIFCVLCICQVYFCIIKFLNQSFIPDFICDVKAKSEANLSYFPVLYSFIPFPAVSPV